MKTLKHIYEHLFDEDVETECIKNVLRGGRKKIKGWLYYKYHPEKLAENYRQIIETYNPTPREPFYRKDPVSGKMRRIIPPTVEDLVIQHAVVLVLEEFFTKPMYDHTYASIPGRGVHLGAKRVKKFISNNPRECKWYLKVDIHHFFQTIDQYILLEKLRKKIKDKKFFRYLEIIIRADSEGGLPLGYYTSHWFANWLLGEVDRYLVEELKVPFYIRYMDDMVIFSSNKKELKVVLELLQLKLSELNLSLKEDIKLVRFYYFDNKGNELGEPLDFMGFLFYRNRTTIRKSIAHRIANAASRISNKKRPTIHDCRRMVSYSGYFNCTDTYGFFRDKVFTKVNISYMKDYISRYDKATNKRIKAIIQAANKKCA